MIKDLFFFQFVCSPANLSPLAESMLEDTGVLLQ